MAMNERGNFLVVGGSGAIGFALARRLIGPGRNIAIHYCRNQEAASQLLGEAKQGGSDGVLLQSGLQTEAECVELVRQAEASLGRLSGIALCGGTIRHWVDSKDLTAAAWQDTLFEHCIAPFMIARTALSQMVEVRKGCIVYLSSISPKYGGSAQTLHYASAKAALETAMYGLARQNAGNGVRINGVRAGFIDTPLQHQGRSPEQLAERISKIPMGRAGKPEEVAAAIAFLLAEEAGFVTGEILTVAGGD